MERRSQKAGFKDIHLSAVQFYGIEDPTEWGFDSAIEFPPHKFITPENRPSNMPNITNPNFAGGLLIIPKWQLKEFRLSPRTILGTEE